MQREDAQNVAEAISLGHAFDKHVLRQREFPEVSSRKQFEALIFAVLTSPSAWKTLPRQRSAYWSDHHRMVVIIDKASSSGGTAFRPLTGKEFYEFRL